MDGFSYKGGHGMCGHTCVKVLKKRAGLGYRLLVVCYVVESHAIY